MPPEHAPFGPAAEPADVAFTPSGRVIRADDARAFREAGAFLDEARRVAGRLRDDALEAFEAERRRGFEEGRRAGAEAAARLHAEAVAAVDRRLAGLEGEIADLVIAGVARVLGEMDARERAVRAVRHGLAGLRHGRRIVVHVAPDRAEAIRRDLADWLATDGEVGAGGELVRVEADPALEGDACLLASELGVVEAGVEGQLRALRAGLRAGSKAP